MSAALHELDDGGLQARNAGAQKWLRRRILGVLDCSGGDRFLERGSAQVEHADGDPEWVFWSLALRQQAGVRRFATVEALAA